MDLALDITTSCRVRILLVPVSPIKKSTFWHHVELVRQFSSVRLGDVTPDLHKGAKAKFSSQVFQEGQMHFQFVTKYNREHCHLEDFQPHRRIFGVIGIMDCREWEGKDLSEGYKKFVDMLGQYPTAVATRCFAFDPTENQPDDTKGLIMIPNVGNMSFYMSTMICDFASEILDQFASIAERIEKLNVLESPIPAGYIPRKFDLKHHSLQPSTSSPLKSNGGPPAPSASISSSFLKRASSTAASSRPMSSSPPTPKPSLSRSTTFSSLTSAGDAGRTMQRTPGRIKKLLADFYLLAGRLPDAIQHYNESIEMANNSYDYLWLSSAKEGLACTMILMDHLYQDAGHIVSRPTISSKEEDVASSIADPTPSKLAPKKSLVTEITDMYEDLLQQYTKVGSTTSIPMPKLIYAEACLKIARFLTTVYVNGGWNDKVLNKIVLQQQSPDEKPKEGKSFVTTADLLKYKSSGLTRFSIAKWVTKIWTIDVDHDLITMDGIHIMTQMASVLSTIGYHRKSAWFMYETLNRMIPLLIQGRAALQSSTHTSAEKKEKENGILQVLKRICEVYGIGESHVEDGGTLHMFNNTNTNNGSTEEASKATTTRKRFGWAALQIDILRECIVISESIGDHASMLYYTTVLLKNLYQHISKDEQIRLASSIQRIVHISKRSNGNSNSNAAAAAAPAVESSHHHSHSGGVNYWGFNIVKGIHPIPPIPRKAIYQHPLLIAKALAASKSIKATSGDPFIYNPFAKKKDDKPQINLIKDETCEFKVVLTNPFGFDLELSNVVLSTSGVEFSAVPTAATIPANETMALRLMGTPLETGALVIRGCIIKITGFAEQEFLSEKPVEAVTAKTEKTNTLVESERYKHTGLAAIFNASTSTLPTSTATTNATTTTTTTTTSSTPVVVESPHEILNVIEDQPLLKIRSTSLLHGAIMLFEGEIQRISIQVENIGNIPVDFITLSFTDSTTIHPKPINPELPTEEQYEIELYTKGTPVFSWEGSKGNQIGKKVDLPPGGRTEIIVHVYGKQGCTGGAIHVDYGYLDRVIKDQQQQQVEQEEKELPATLYTRQLYLPIMISVYQNLDPLNWDVLYLRGNTTVTQDQVQEAMTQIQSLDLSSMEKTSGEQPVEQLLVLTQQANDEQDKNPYCLLTLDVRNTWTVPFDIQFNVDNSEGGENEDNKLKSTVTIQPSITKRIVLPLKKLFLTSEQRLQPVPSFEPNKQFVVSQAPKMAPEQERARLQMFWYREQLLTRVTASWKCKDGSGRQGSMNLRRSLRLTPLQLGVLKKGDIEFIVDMPANHIVGHRQFQCSVNSFVHMKVTIVNRQTRPVKLILRVQPVQSYNDGAKEYDLTEKLLMQGVSQLVLPEIPPHGGEYAIEFPLCFLSRGKFEFLYHVEDVHTREMYYDHDWAFVHVSDV